MERIDLGKCNRRIKGFYPWVPVKNKSVEIEKRSLGCYGLDSRDRSGRASL